MTSALKLSMTVLTTIAMLHGCGSGTGSSGPDAGSFTATVTPAGQAPVTLTGFAPSFGNASDANWYVQMVTPGGGSSLMLFYTGADRPPVGEHAIENYVEHDAAPPEGTFLATGGSDSATLQGIDLASITGTVTITASSSTSIVGTVEYQSGAFGANPGAAVTIQFSSHNTEQ